MAKPTGVSVTISQVYIISTHIRKLWAHIRKLMSSDVVRTGVCDEISVLCAHDW